MHLIRIRKLVDIQVPQVVTNLIFAHSFIYVSSDHLHWITIQYFLPSLLVSNQRFSDFRSNCGRKTTMVIKE